MLLCLYFVNTSGSIISGSESVCIVGCHCYLDPAIDMIDFLRICLESLDFQTLFYFVSSTLEAFNPGKFFSPPDLKVHNSVHVANTNEKR